MKFTLLVPYSDVVCINFLSNQIIRKIIITIIIRFRRKSLLKMLIKLQPNRKHKSLLVEGH